MGMKAAQRTAIRQKQALSTQLVQSLRILEMPMHELEKYLQEQFMNNPFVELGNEHSPMPPEERYRPWAKGEGSVRYDPYAALANIASTADDREKLKTQARDLALAPNEEAIALLLIDDLDESGFLPDEYRKLARIGECNEEDIERMAKLLQAKLEPTGLFTKGPRQYLKLQLTSLPNSTPGKAAAIHIVDSAFEDFVAGKFNKVARALSLGANEVRRARDLMATLSTSPLRSHAGYGDAEKRISIDATAVRGPNGWHVAVNHSASLLTMNEHYAQLERSCSDESTGRFLTAKHREWNDLARGLKRRDETLAQVARAIVEQQLPFFEAGSSILPLTHAEIAQQLGVSESTVSRAVAGKYLQSPRGLLPLSHFFQRAASRRSFEGNLVTSDAKRLVIELISQENPFSPLSDADIAAKLETMGVSVSRRTVAKYRGQEGIASSCARRKTA